jgi:hypothetical protein
LNSPAWTGIVIRIVNPESPAGVAGLRDNDVIVTPLAAAEVSEIRMVAAWAQTDQGSVSPCRHLSSLQHHP